MKILIQLLIFICMTKFAFGKEIVMGVGALPIPAELPHVRSTNKTQVLRQIYDSLFTVNDNGNVQSAFFSEWKVSIPNRTITFKKIEGIRFSDGTAITNLDLINVLKRTLEDGKVILPEIDSVQINKDNLIEVRLKKISSTIFDKLTDISFAVYSKKKDQWGFPIGSGIFKIVGVTSSQIKLTRNNMHVDFKSGNIENITINLLLKSKYTTSEIEALGMDFFPLTQISDSTAKSHNFNRVIYPSHRITAVVLNIESLGDRKTLKACIDSTGLMLMPYLNHEITPYYSIIPSGIENYQPEDRLKNSFNKNECEKGLRKITKNKSYTWLNSYASPDDIAFIESFVLKINKLASRDVIKIKNVSLQEAQEHIKIGAFDIFLCGIGSPIPIVDGIISDFIYTKGRSDTLVKYVDPLIQKRFGEFQIASDSLRKAKIQELVSAILDGAWVVPFGRKVSTFYIPKLWSGLTMVNGMNGNFYLGKVVVGD